MVTLAHNNVVYVFQNPEELYSAVADDFKNRSNRAIKERGKFTVVLSGGNTPKLLFSKLADFKNEIPWNKIKFFFGDERYVPSLNTENNYHTAYEYLFSKVPVLMENIYPIPTYFQNPEEAAKDYELTLRKAFNIKENEFPKFDLVYLGLGDDAHTASLMPFSEPVMKYDIKDQIEKTNYLVDSLWFEEQGMYRITLMPAAFNKALNIIFIVSGATKASAVCRVIEGPLEPNKYPAQLIHCVNYPNIWYLDKASASKLLFLNSNGLKKNEN